MEELNKLKKGDSFLIKILALFYFTSLFVLRRQQSLVTWERKIRKALSAVENYCITNPWSIIFFHVYFDHWVKKMIYQTSLKMLTLNITSYKNQDATCMKFEKSYIKQ